MPKRQLRGLSAALLTLAAQLASAYDSKFVYPPPGEQNLSFNILDQINVTYDTDFKNPTIWLFCNDANSYMHAQINQRARSGVSSFEVTLGFQEAVSPCWFNLRDDAANGTLGIKSGAFMYNSTARAVPAAFGPPAVSASPTPTSSAAVVSSSAASTPSSNAPITSASSLPTAAIAGIAVGAAAAGGLIILGATLLLVARRRCRERNPVESQQPEVVVFYSGPEARHYDGDGASDASTHVFSKTGRRVHDVTPRAPQELPVHTQDLFFIAPQELPAHEIDWRP